MNVPADLKYTKTHEWIRMDGDTATIGITDYAQSELGDIVFVDLPKVGRNLDTAESFCSVESVKTVSEVYAPIPGEVVEVNSELASRAELINSEPYESGWLIKIKAASPVTAQNFLDASAYQQVID